jgi:PRTRC genetic system protein B
MTDVTNAFGTLYHPQKALLVYAASQNHTQPYYIEAYDLDTEGKPVNAHPLSVSEANSLVKALQTAERKKNGLLTLKGLMPKNVLHLKTDQNPYAIWYTPAQSVPLFFKADLGIPSGLCALPALLWKATKKGMAIYALADDADITLETPLYHAPFFNVYEDGRVCMGNTQVSIPKDCSLEEFMRLWQEAFYNSYFSHLMHGHLPVKGNIVQLWKGLSGTGKPFPAQVLIPNKSTLKHLIP